MQLSYKAVTAQGKKMSGVIEARNASEAAKFLRAQNFIPTIITPIKKQDLLSLLPFIKKISSKDLVFFTRQLSSMLTSGITLIQALRILNEQTQKAALNDLLKNIIADIEQGSTLYLSLSKYPDVFSPVYISLVQSAEQSGLLDKAFGRLADTLEKNATLRSAIVGSLIYPVVVIGAMIVVMLIMMFFVIPQLSTLYDSLNVPLPLPTLIILGLSHFMVTFWPLVAILFGVLVIMINRWYKTPTGRLLIDDFMLKLPVFGKLMSETVLSEFTRTFGLLIGTGGLVVPALIQSSEASANLLYKNAILAVSQRVEKGISVGDSMSISPLFPPILVQSVKIGEQTGKLDESLLHVADYFQREVEQIVKNLTTLIEPIIMVILGVGVAFLIIAIITPIYSLTNAIH